ncbi:prepilin-type N-terminal cleavage/methylation domain-containing protein [Thiomicrorhabdus sp.]|uniref:type II secretion system protein n=1 Tax=Thiomicrorhabdus sp. TaxID=2039724 RepID=UPI002AA8978B|nr:prepilin-type N-terminal cleavage/methylation domain-containing protein [Thiomicrorhabdus sp.]
MIIQNKYKGFSLIEMAVVLAIVGVLITGILSFTGEFRAVSKQNISEKKLKDIKAQLIKFAMINKYLPCPGNNGREDRALTGECNNTSGEVPYLDIGFKRDDVVDSYGNFIRYAINQNANNPALICNNASSASYFCNSTPGTAVFDLTNTPPIAGNDGLGNYTVLNSTGGIDSNTAIVVLVAYNADGEQTLTAAAPNSCQAGVVLPINIENCDLDLLYNKAQQSTDNVNFFDDSIETITGYEIKSTALSPITVWNNSTVPSSVLPPTYRGYDLTPGAYLPNDSTSERDVIKVDHNVADSLSLGKGDDVVLMGGSLASKLEYNNKTGKITSNGDKADLDTGDGNDSVYIGEEAYSNVQLGDGDDQFILGSDLIADLYAGAGNDQIWIQGNINSGSNLDLGSGDDVLWLGNADDPNSGLLNRAIDGGDGTDILVLENYKTVDEFQAKNNLYDLIHFEYIVFADDGTGHRDYCTYTVDCYK